MSVTLRLADRDAAVIARILTAVSNLPDTYHTDNAAEILHRLERGVIGGSSWTVGEYQHRLSDAQRLGAAFETALRANAPAR